MTLGRAWTHVLRSCRALGRRRGRWILLLGLLGFAGSLSVGLARGIPLPRIHDEFSYLLAADTFSEGRLTNPTHPHWEHFESFHIIHQPTYQSKYPPGQGAVLALGQVTAGHAVVGLWLSAGLMAAAVGWALLIWLPPAWAVLSGGIFTVHLSWFSYWAQSYWGGAVAATGGALAIGAFRSLLNGPRIVHGLIFGAGLGIMAMSRPFEGALLGLLLCGAMTIRCLRVSSRSLRQLVLWGGCPAALVLLPLLGGVAHYNEQVTGSPTSFPYQVHEAQYAASPSFLFQSPPPAPTYRHDEIERFWMTWGLERYERLRSANGLASHVLRKVTDQFLILLGAAVIFLIGASRLVSGLPDSHPIHGSHLRFGLLAAAVVMGASLLTAGAYAHYVAPVTALLYVGVGAGMAGLHRRARTRGSLNLVPVLFVLIVAGTVGSGVLRLWSSGPQFPLEREGISQEIEAVGGKHLVLVSYGPAHNVHEEWVYNRADIDGARVVWARSMDPDSDRRLNEYFKDRSVWCLEVDQEPQLSSSQPTQSEAAPCSFE